METVEAVTQKENPEKKKSRKKGHKILIQIGVMIIVLFTLVIIAVSNMITMASFSTALSTDMTMFTSYMSNLAGNIEKYESFTWLMDYWRDNADSLAEELDSKEQNDDIKDILKTLSKESAEEVTEKEAASLSPEDQRRFAICCYEEMQEMFKLYKDENGNSAIFLTMTEKDGEDPVVILTDIDDDGVLLGGDRKHHGDQKGNS